MISDAAPICIGCGRPMHAGASAPATPALPDAVHARLQPSGYGCPKCGGDLIAYPALHEATEGGSVPQAARFGPPDRGLIALEGGSCVRPLLGAVILAGLTWWVSNGFLAALALVFGFIAFSKLAAIRSKPLVDERYRESMQRWQQRHLCTTCGATAFRSDNGELRVEEADAELDALIRSGQKIQAIKLMRDRTGLGLKEAKEAVEARERQL